MEQLHEEHGPAQQEAVARSRREIIRRSVVLFVVLAAAVLAVVAYLTRAWFAANDTVTGEGTSISANGSRFELASVGNRGSQDGDLPHADQLEGSVWENYDDGRITNSSDTILWRVSDSSNLGNHGSSPGIEPGSSGTLQFYVVPKDDEPLKLTFSLEFLPLMVQEEKFAPINDPVAENFLKGHLLVRYRLGADGKSTLVDPESGSFSLTVTGPDPVLVSLDWSWPYLLEDALKDAEVASRINSYPQFFLYDGNAPVTDLGTIPQQNDPQFRKYSIFYNNADQYIGTKVSAVLLRLTADV